MKAAHRKELETNALADALGRFIQSVKSGPQTLLAKLLWLGIAALVVGVIVWRLFGRVNPAEESARWVQLSAALADPNDAPMRFKQISSEYPDTMQARMAQFQEARLTLRRGQESLAADAERRAKAIENLRHARQLYEQLIKQSKAFPVLYQEALLGAAKAEECLAGVDSSESSATFERAVELYQQTIQANFREFGQNVELSGALEALQQALAEQLRQLGHETPVENSLLVYQKLQETAPELFTGDAAAFRDRTFPARIAALRLLALQKQRDEVAKFYAEFDRLAGPRKSDPKTP